MNEEEGVKVTSSKLRFDQMKKMAQFGGKVAKTVNGQHIYIKLEKEEEGIKVTLSKAQCDQQNLNMA